LIYFLPILANLPNLPIRPILPSLPILPNLPILVTFAKLDTFPSFADLSVEIGESNGVLATMAFLVVFRLLIKDFF
jgi:hypothetical protein